jgi:NAD(P)-dependent dehydrogenase (short-subunit alcohol dehydrogenase family)
MGQGGRVVAITYAPGGLRGTWQPWVAMGSAKAALESLVRYFAVALAPRGITVNSVSPGLTDDSVLQSFGDAAVDVARTWHASGWTPMGRMGTPADIGRAPVLAGGGLDHRPAALRRRRRITGGHAAASRDPAGLSRREPSAEEDLT